MKSPYILSIDTSCDDTSAAVTCGTVVLSNVVASQIQLHKQYGGVFPTVAKQAHKENIEPVVKAAMRKAHLQFADLAAVAVTQGPGLAPALEVGVEAAKNLAQKYNKPLIPVNHIEGHILAVLARPMDSRVKPEDDNVCHPRESGDPLESTGFRIKSGMTTEQYQKTQTELEKQKFPVLAIIVSGGHTEFIKVSSFGQYERLGFTVDDAAGEALDKFGRMVDLGYPAGALIEQFAKLGNKNAFQFPLPMTTSGNANMSFSGLKTSARNLTEKMQAGDVLVKQQVYDLCASFQYAVFHAITYKLNKVLTEQQFFAVWLGGGVASNVALRSAIRKTLQPFKLRLQVPHSKRLCSDNAAMIGIAAGFKLEHGKTFLNPESVERKPRWEIDQTDGS